MYHSRTPVGRSRFRPGDLDTSGLGDNDTKADEMSSGSILDRGFLLDLNTASQFSSFFFIFRPSRAFGCSQGSSCRLGFGAFDSFAIFVYMYINRDSDLKSWACQCTVVGSVQKMRRHALFVQKPRFYRFCARSFE